MAASLEGTFRLRDRASGTFGRLEMAATRTDRSFQRLGGRLERHGQMMQRMNRENRDAEQGFGRLTRTMAKFVVVAEGVGKALKGMKLIGMAVGIRYLIPLVASLGGGLAALIPKLTDIGGAAGSLPALFTGMGLAMGTVKLATKDLSQALSGNEKALKRLTPEARRFLETLKAAQPVLDSIKRSSQRGLFPGLEDAVRQLVKAAPVMRQLTGQMGKALGGLASQAAGRFTSRGFLNDLQTLGAQGIRVVRLLGMGLLNLIDVLRNVGVAAVPFTDWLSKTVYGWTAWLKAVSQVKRDSGALAAFFARTRKSLETFGSILKSSYTILRDVGHAARALGDSMWASAERSMKAWARWTSSITGQESMKAWFASTRSTLGQIFGLVGDITKALARMSGQGGSASLVRGLRDFVPVIERVLNGLQKTFGPPMIALLHEFGRTLDFYVNRTSFPVASLLGVMAKLLKAVNDLIDRFPTLGRVVSAAVSGWATYALFKQIGLIRGLGAAWAMVARSAGAAAAAQGAAAATSVGGSAVGALTAAEAGSAGGAWVRAAGGAAAAGGAGLAAGGAGLAARFGAGGLGVAARGALGVAGKVVLPLAALQFGIGALMAKREGGFFDQVGQSAYGGLNSLAFGLLPEHLTDSQKAQRFAGGMLGGSYEDPGRAVMAQRAVTQYAGARGGPARTVMQSYATHPFAQTKIGVQGYLDQAAALQPKNLAGVVQQIKYAKSAVSLAQHAQALGAKNAADALASARQTLKVYQEQGAELLSQERAQRRAGRVRDAHQVANRLLNGLQQSLASDEKRLGRVPALKAFRERLSSAILAVAPSERGQFAKAGEAVANAATSGLRKGSKAYAEASKAAKDLKSDIVKTLRSTGQAALQTNGKVVADANKQWPKWRDAILREAKAAEVQLPNHLAAIRAEAATGLRTMGYNDKQIQSILGSAASGATASQALGAGSSGTANGGSFPGGGSSPMTGGLASGGRIRGSGLRDTVPISSGSIAAPGELVVNRHTEHRVDRILRGAGTSLDREVRTEGRPHSAPMRFAKGGRTPFAYPLGVRGQLIGTPYSGTHTLGNWQSDRAVDLGVPVGTPVLATDAGVIGSRFGSLGASAGSRFAGLRMTLNTASDAFYYAHLSRYAAGIHPGASVRRGQVLGYSGSANGVAHLHLGEEIGNPMALIGAAIQAAQTLKRIKAAGFGRGMIRPMTQAAAQGYANGLVSMVNRRLSPPATAGDAGLSAAAGGRSIIATTFGGPSDPGTGSTGYHGDNLNGQNAYAELGMGTRLGNLPYRTPMRISYHGNSLVARKLDIGAGAPGASLDLWYQTARALGFPEPGKDSVQIQRLAQGGRVGWGGWHARGADFTASRPTLIGVGEKGTERVTVTPKGARVGGVQVAGPLIGQIVVHASHPGATGDAIVAEIDRAMRRVADELYSSADDGAVTR